jgi:uncharacterized protein YggU (UPF0235/DUF167 family)
MSSGRRSSAASEAFFRIEPEGAALFVRASPGAARESVGGRWTGPDGEARLVVRVVAPADRGRANRAVCALIARALGLPKSAVSIRAGAKDRLKTLAVAGEAGDLAQRLSRLAANESSGDGA